MRENPRRPSGAPQERRRHPLRSLRSLVLLLLAATWTAGGLPLAATDEHPALVALDGYMAAWNSRVAVDWAATLHFPHTRQSVERARVWESAEDYVAGVDWGPLVASGWVRSAWDTKELVHTGSDKAHVAGVWSRFDGDGERMRTTQVVYVVGKERSRWGVQARFAAGAPTDAETAAASEAAALFTVEEYMQAFNARDPVAWAATLNYPHVRLASGTIRVWESAEEYASWMDFDRFARETGWQRSRWDRMRAVQVAADAVNVALTFTRFDAGDQAIASYSTLYLVTRQDGHWGVRARSSFAP